MSDLIPFFFSLLYLGAFFCCSFAIPCFSLRRLDFAVVSRLDMLACVVSISAIVQAAARHWQSVAIGWHKRAGSGRGCPRRISFAHASTPSLEIGGMLIFKIIHSVLGFHSLKLDKF